MTDFFFVGSYNISVPFFDIQEIYKGLMHLNTYTHKRYIFSLLTRNTNLPKRTLRFYKYLIVQC